MRANVCSVGIDSCY